MEHPPSQNPHFSRKERARNGAPGKDGAPAVVKSPLLAQRAREKWGTRLLAPYNHLEDDSSVFNFVILFWSVNL